MEVMSCLLLCAVVGLLPQTLGLRKDVGFSYLFNKTVFMKSKKFKWTKPNNIMLNINPNPPNLEFDVLNDYSCKLCQDCIHRAIKRLNIQVPVLPEQPTRINLPDVEIIGLIQNGIQRYREKRDTQSDSDSDTQWPKRMNKKKTRSRKNKAQKSIAVTKYNLNGNVFALKVKENARNLSAHTDNHYFYPYMNNTHLSTCHVYSVQESYPCESPEGHMILNGTQNKLNKGIHEYKSGTEGVTHNSSITEGIKHDSSSAEKVEQYKRSKAEVGHRKAEVSNITIKAIPESAMFRRHTYSSQMPENEGGLTSVEEFY